MPQQEHLELGDRRIGGRNLFVRSFFKERTRTGHMGIFFKDVMQEREVEEGKNSQGVMFFELSGRMKNCLNHESSSLSLKMRCLYGERKFLKLNGGWERNDSEIFLSMDSISCAVCERVDSSYTERLNHSLIGMPDFKSNRGL